MSDMINSMYDRIDIALTAMYGLGIAMLTGLITGTLAPQANGGVGYSFNEILYNLGGATEAEATISITVGLALTLVSSFVIFATNHMEDSSDITKVFDTKNYDSLMFLGVFLVPVAHELSTTVSNLTAGTAGQVAVVVLLVGLTTVIADLPSRK